jgi:UDP-N-acetylglucosamine 2-epimerase (non-hydrolysing)
VKVVIVVGARPNFMKAMPLIRALRKRGDEALLVHTGQHHDWKLSGAIFSDLGMPEPDVNLELGSLPRSEFVMRATTGLRKVLHEARPDWAVVVGDVNSTLAGALAASKEGVRLAHVEAGLRSRDERMTEEFNRKQVDALADLLLTTSDEASENLKAEGVIGRTALVGNTMIDTLVWSFPTIRERADLIDRPPYGVVTLHRPELVDDVGQLTRALAELNRVHKAIPLVFPVHPRTRAKMAACGMIVLNFELTDPMPYVDFMALVSKASFVLTDSGGLQEETSFLGIPCLTMRESTERPETLRLGTNRLIKIEGLHDAVAEILGAKPPEAKSIPFWDGRAAERIVDELRA